EIPDVSEADEGGYRVAVKSASGASLSETIYLVVNVPPTIAAQPGTVFASPGETVSLAVQIGGSQPMEYTWRKGEMEVGQNAGSALALGSVTASDAGEYRLTVSNAAGEITTDLIVLRVIVNYDDWTEWQ